MSFKRAPVYLNDNSGFDKNQILQINSMLKSSYQKAEEKGTQKQLTNHFSNSDIVKATTGRLSGLQTYSSPDLTTLYFYFYLGEIEAGLNYDVIELKDEYKNMTNFSFLAYLNLGMTFDFSKYGYFYFSDGYIRFHSNVEFSGDYLTAYINVTLVRGK